MRLLVVSDGPIFSVLPEKIGEKRALGRGLVHAASDFRQAPMVQASFHMIVTLRVFYYAPPDTVGIEFGTSCFRTIAVNRRCGGEPDGSYLLAGQIVRTKKKIQCKKMQANKSGLHLLFTANIQTQLPPNHVPTYQAARTRTYVR